MSKIKIKNFGPIKEGYPDHGGFLNINDVTVFIGNQGSGKSTVAKIISTLTWLEKALNRGDITKAKISNAAFWEFFKYHRIHNYFKEDTEIEFIGEKLHLKYSKSLPYPEITLKDQHSYKVPKIMYVPAERNFLSVVKNAYGLTNLPRSLYTFAEELRKGQNQLNEQKISLPIEGISYRYDKEEDISYLVSDQYQVNLLESSSGYQSLVPLYLVTKFLSEELLTGKDMRREQLSVEQNVRRKNEISSIMFDTSLTDQEKAEKVKKVDEKYLNSCFVNIIEEPEQNLFPTSQWQMLKSLLSFNNSQSGNKLVITTHSPYIINYLSITIQGAYLANKIGHDETLIKKLSNLIPKNSLVPGESVDIYQIDDKSGVIHKLPNPESIPSDQNYLNQSLRHGNEIFDSLLEIEEEI